MLLYHLMILCFMLVSCYYFRKMVRLAIMLRMLLSKKKKNSVGLNRLKFVVNFAKIEVYPPPPPVLLRTLEYD